jgi:group II intron reverse transcriptase/maturase
MRPKASGGEWPLTVAPPRDKVVQEVMRMILEAIFEPEFSKNSHGFRPNRSCHTALRQILTTFGVASWYIEGDISKCFDSFDHEILIKIIRRRIKDERFIRLIYKAIKAGYFEFGEYKHSIIGTPQGSIISPLLCNIYMNFFDKYIDFLSGKFSLGDRPRVNPLWISYNNKKTRAKTLQEKIKWHKLQLKVPSKARLGGARPGGEFFFKKKNTHPPLDPKFKKLVYVRYADDWIIGVRGSHKDCENLLSKIKEFLTNELKLSLSESKTLITNANKQKALFLGTWILKSRHQIYHRALGYIKRVGREIRLELPLERVVKKLKEANFIKNDIASPKFLWIHNSKDQIVTLYNSVYRGFINYYSFAHNLGTCSGFIHNTLKSSCAKLLAAKFTLTSQSKVFDRFGKNLKGNDNISFVSPIYRSNKWDFKGAKPNKNGNIVDNGIIKTLYAESISIASLEDLACSVCDSEHRVEMHHVRHLKDLNPKLSKIDALMAKRRLKQIPLCRKCHLEYHRAKK